MGVLNSLKIARLYGEALGKKIGYRLVGACDLPLGWSKSLDRCGARGERLRLKPGVVID